MKLGLGLAIMAIVFFFQVNLSSCTKNSVQIKTDTVNTIQIKIDTVNVIIKDTLTNLIKDTSILGTWVGTYSVDQFPSYTPAYSCLILLPNDSLIQKNISIGTGPGSGIAYYNRGTWTLNGNTLNCSITTLNFPVNVTETMNYTFNAGARTLTNGIWTDLSGQADSGTFSTLVKTD